MRRASRKNGVEVPSEAFSVVCVHNGRNQPCFGRDPRKAHRECINFRCSVCGTDYTGADIHEKSLDEYARPACYHLSAIEQQAMAIQVSDELSELDSIEAELRSL